MRVLLDECLPRQLRRDLPGHDVRTVPEMGWAAMANGALLRTASAAGFEAFVTIDRGIEFQQNVSGLGLGVIASRARSNDVAHLRPLMSAVLDALASLRPGGLVRIPR